jgi:hypothetical protein
MPKLRGLTTAIVNTAQAARQLVKEAREVAGLARSTGQTVGDNLVDAATTTIPSVASAVVQIGSTAARLVSSPAGQRLAGLLVQAALAQAARVAVRTAFGPIAGNIAAGVIGLAVGLREAQRPLPRMTMPPPHSTGTV